MKTSDTCRPPNSKRLFRFSMASTVVSPPAIMRVLNTPILPLQGPKMSILVILVKTNKINNNIYNNLCKKDQDILEITSFDNDLEWCYKKNEYDNCLNLHIRELIECNEKDFNEQIKTKKLNKKVFSIRNTPPTWRQRN